ncbi:MAG: SMP-30/gluconolactonase/LRE family protein [Anditalea sp.]
MKLLFLLLFNSLTFLGMLYVNYFFASGAGGQETVGEVSDKYPTLITPADYAFSIWGLIYLLLIGFLGFQWVKFMKRNTHESLEKAGIWFSLANIFNGLWIVVWINGWLGFSVLIIFLLLFSLIQLVIRLKLEIWDAPKRIIVFVWWPISIYIGWIIIATVTNVSCHKKYKNFPIPDWEQHLKSRNMEIGSKRLNNFFFRPGLLVALFSLSILLGCGDQVEKESVTAEIERNDPRLDGIISKDAQVEVLAEGFDWTEGPLWIEGHQMLLFSDIPPNSIYKWTEGKGVELYLEPSGYTQEPSRGGEVGSNGLLLDSNGQLVLCQHGDRRIARMQASLGQPKPDYITIVEDYQGKKLNSPNDAVYKENGDLYFTDPPYGLEENVKDPLKEIPYQGVYKVSADGQVTLLLDSLTRPNGIAFLPGEETLIIANSDPDKPFWYAYDLDGKGELVNGRVFYDATAASKIDKGMPDGLKVDSQGNVFATGPGGIWIFSRGGEVLGRIKINQLTSNCALAHQETALFITADNFLLKMDLR